MGLDGSLADWRTDQARALQLPGVLAAAPYIEAQALLTHGGARQRYRGARHRAGAGTRAVGLAQHIQGGRVEDLTDGSYRIVLGDALGAALGVRHRR